MTGHAAHAAIESAAAVVLVLTGALFLAVAAHQRRVVALGVPTGTGPGTTPIERPLALSIPVAVAVALSLGAAAIHLAAGPSHVEELGDLGLGFYWAALFQAGWAVAYAVRRSHAVAVGRDRRERGDRRCVARVPHPRAAGRQRAVASRGDRCPGR